MKILLRIILIGLVAYFVPYVLPWWTLAFFAMIIGFVISGHALNSFISGFLGGGAVWLVLAWMIDNETQSVLSNRIVQLFPVNEVIYLIIATGLIGGLISGFGMVTGTSFRQIFIKKKSRSLYSS
ncbi:MAG: hypothetical protein R8G66_10915 [Cytophagales bacterium]|nr:hypothetical protein [Cytophagales bacterium]